MGACLTYKGQDERKCKSACGIIIEILNKSNRSKKPVLERLGIYMTVKNQNAIYKTMLIVDFKGTLKILFMSILTTFMDILDLIFLSLTQVRINGITSALKYVSGTRICPFLLGNDLDLVV